MGFHAATIATVPPGASLSIVGTVPATTGGDTLFALYNADEVTTPLTTPSDFTQIDTYQTSSYDLNTAAIFSFTANGGAGFPSSGGPTTYTFTTSGQSYPSTSLLLLSWTGTGVTPTAAQATVIASAHVAPTTATLTGCACNPGDEIFVFVAGDSVSASSSAYTISAVGFTVGSGATGGDGYSPVAVLASVATATGSSTGSITITIVDAHGGTDDFGGVIAWVVAMPPSGGGGGIGPIVDVQRPLRSQAAPLCAMRASDALPPLSAPAATRAAMQQHAVTTVRPVQWSAPIVASLPNLPKLTSWVPDTNVPRPRSEIGRLVMQGAALPPVVRPYAAVALPALPLPAPAVQRQSDCLPRVYVLGAPWFDTQQQPRAAAAPNRQAAEQPLPPINRGWAPDAQAGRAAPDPLRATRNDTLPAVVSSAAITAWGYSAEAPKQMQCSPLRSAQFDALPAIPAAASLAPWGFETAPVARAMQRPAAADAVAPIPSVARLPPAIFESAPTQRMQPSPSVFGAQPSLPALFAHLTPWGFDSPAQFRLPAMAQRQEVAAIPAVASVPLTSWGFDTLPMRLAQAPARSEAPGIAWPLQRLAPGGFESSAQRSATVQTAQMLPALALPSTGPRPWVFDAPQQARSQGPLRATAYGDVLRGLQRLAPWIEAAVSLRALAGPQRALFVPFAFAPLGGVTVPSEPGCAHSAITALYSATGAMFLTAQATGIIGGTASAITKVTRCT